MYAKAAINAYTKIGIESGVTAADPHQLISMLYQGAMQATSNAKYAILRADTSAKCLAISKAIMIIDDGLKASLDKKVGGELALNLAALYGYLSARLLHANVHNDTYALDEVNQLLNELNEAWESIRPKTSSANSTAKSSGEIRMIYEKG